MGQAFPRRSVGNCLLCSVLQAPAQTPRPTQVTAVQQQPQPSLPPPVPSTCKTPKTVFLLFYRALACLSSGGDCSLCEQGLYLSL